MPVSRIESPAPAKTRAAEALPGDIAQRLREAIADGAVLAVSGGPDSMALLHLARRAAPDASLLALTVDHGLRPESANEADFVAAACRRIGVPHRTLRWRGGRPAGGVQAAAREARYRLLSEAAQDAGLTAILTAHHRDDQAETVWMRLQRTSEPRSLAGIAPHRRVPGTAIDVRRPLLDVPRAALAAWLRAAGIAALEDPSNADRRYERARVRSTMPALADEGATPERLAAFADLMGRLTRVNDREARRRLATATVSDDAVVSAGVALLGPPVPVAREALRRILLAFGPRAVDPAPLARAHAALLAGEGVRTLAGVRLERRGDRIVASRERGRTVLPAPPIRPGETISWDHRFEVTAPGALPDGARVAAFSSTGRGGARLGSLPVIVARGAVVAAPDELCARYSDLPDGLASREIVSRGLHDR